MYATKTIEEGQYSLQPPTNLQSFGIAFTSWVPIDQIHLYTPNSYVNDTIIEARKNLTELYMENKYYMQHTIRLQSPQNYDRVYQGAVKLDSDFMDAMIAINAGAKSNLFTMVGLH